MTSEPSRCDGVLLAVGEAPHAWLASSQKTSQGIPEVKSFDSTGVVDLDLERYQLLVQGIGERPIYFTAGTSSPLNSLRKRLEQSDREHREELLAARQKLSDDLRKRTEELEAELHLTSQSLSSGKTDRSTMAALLNDMALRLAAEDE